MTVIATDQQLVARVQKGDSRAFDMLVLKYQHKIFSLISRYVRDADEVQDVAQEAFIKAYRSLPGFGVIVLFIPGCIVLRSTPRRIIWCHARDGLRGQMLSLRTLSTLKAEGVYARLKRPRMRYSVRS